MRLLLLYAFVLCANVALGNSISQIAFRGEISSPHLSPLQRESVTWLVPQLGIRANIGRGEMQKIMEQLLFKPHFPLRDVINSYIMANESFLDIEDKYLLINYITNHTHFAQSYVDEKRIDPSEFAKIIENAKTHNVLDEDFLKYLKAYYSTAQKIDRQISATKFGKPATSEIQKSIDKLSDKSAKLILYARLFVRGDVKYRKHYERAEDLKLSSEMLLFDKILYHYERKSYAKIAQYIPQLPSTLHNSEAWWDGTQVMILHLMEYGFKKEAHMLLSRIHLNVTHKNYIRKEMWTGAVAMLLNKPNHAFENFHNIFINAQSVDEKSQGAYFVAQSYLKMNNKDAYRYWIEQALTWPMTFYGTRAIDERYDLSHSFIVGSSSYLTARWHKQNEERREVYKRQYSHFIAENILKKQKSYKELPGYLMETMTIAKIMKEGGYFEYAKSFVLSTVSHVTEITQMRSLLEHVCTEYNKYICADAKHTAEAVGYVDMAEFKTIKSQGIHKNIQRSHVALLHGIVKKESNFKETVTSRAGARGMMQVMPATARFICSKHNISYSYRKLQHDASYSLLLGSTYLNDLLEMYGGSYVKALAAYNAGYGNVAKWDGIYFSPTNYQEGILMIELMPFFETRNYVKKVMMWEGIYGYMFSLEKQ